MVSESLPKTYQRLVAPAVGGSFREVATVQKADMRSPGDAEVMDYLLIASMHFQTSKVRLHSFPAQEVIASHS